MSTASVQVEFVGRVRDPESDDTGAAPFDPITFMRSLGSRAGTDVQVNLPTELTTALERRARPAGHTRQAARRFSEASAVPALAATRCRLVSVDHRHRVRLAAVARRIELPREYVVVELGDGFAVLSDRPSASGIKLRVDPQSRLKLTLGVAHRVGVTSSTRQLLVTTEASGELALVHLGALLVRVRQAITAEH